VDEAYRRECKSSVPSWRRRVDTSDGVDRCEAETIVDAVFLRYPIGCGGPNYPRDAGANWLIPVLVGLGGTPATGLFVRKTDGHVSGRADWLEHTPMLDLDVSTILADREQHMHSAPAVRFRDGVVVPDAG
jgi:hypothetical protein